MKLDAHDVRPGRTSASPARPLALGDLWSAYRTGGGAICVRCERSASLVAAVRYEPRGYQLICATCGWGTPWFDWRDGAIALLGLDRFGRAENGGGK
jgi:hypothetical protein